MSAGDAFEQRLRPAIVFGNTAAYRAGATCILRRHRKNVAAQSQRLPLKLGEENPPALIENGTVETALLCNASAGLLNSSLRGCRHVLDLQVRECLDFCVQGGFQGGSQPRLPFVYRGLKINDQRLRGTLSRRHKCAKRGECGAPSGGFHHTLHHSIALVNRSPNSRANCGMADDHLVLARVQVSV